MALEAVLVLKTLLSYLLEDDVTYYIIFRTPKNNHITLVGENSLAY